MSTLLSLKWNHHHSTFVSVFAALKRQDLFSDVSIICGARIFPAHKIVLAASSPFFQQMLAKQPLCTQHHALVIVLQDVDCGDFEILLDYMYKGEAAVQQMALSRLIKTAEKLKIRGLAGCDSSPQLDRDNEAMLAAAACDKVADRLYIANSEQPRGSGISTSQQTKNERLLRRLSEFSETFSDASCEANDAQDKETESQIENIDNNRLLQSIVNNIDIVKIGSEVTANSSWNKSLDSDEIVTEDDIIEDDSTSKDKAYMQITEEEAETDKASTAKRKTKDQVFSDKDENSLSKRSKNEDANENVSKTHHNFSSLSACNDASDADSEDPSQEQLLDAKIWSVSASEWNQWPQPNNAYTASATGTTAAPLTPMVTFPSLVTSAATKKAVAVPPSVFTPQKSAATLQDDMSDEEEQHWINMSDETTNNLSSADIEDKNQKEPYEDLLEISNSKSPEVEETLKEDVSKLHQVQSDMSGVQSDMSAVQSDVSGSSNDASMLPVHAMSVFERNKSTNNTDSSNNEEIIIQSTFNFGTQNSLATPWTCMGCSFKTNDAQIFTVHTQFCQGCKADEKPFKCHKCLYSARSQSALNYHQKTHLGVKPYACNHCNYRTILKRSLVVHQRTHTQEKPFACQLCSYRANQKSNLDTHMARHNSK